MPKYSIELITEESELRQNDLVIDVDDGRIYEVIDAFSPGTGEPARLFYDSKKVIYRTFSYFGERRLIRYYDVQKSGCIDKKYLDINNWQMVKSEPNIEFIRDQLIGKFYAHFKGNRYEIIDVVLDSDDLSVRVVYRDIDDDNKRWVRRYPEFFQYVDTDTYSGPRFKEIDSSQI